MSKGKWIMQDKKDVFPWILAAGDVAALLVFIFIGQRDHQTYTGIRDLIQSTVIFALPWLLVGWQLDSFPPMADKNPTYLLQSGLVTWLGAAPLGILLRAYVMDKVIIPRAFLTATYVFGGLMILGWRLVFGITWHLSNKQKETPSRPTGEDSTRKRKQSHSSRGDFMFNPYLLMSILFISMSVLGAVDNALGQFSIVPAYNGIRWLRIHLITLGAITEALFGLVPLLVSARKGEETPEVRWDIWLALNAGLITLLVGIPLVNKTLILTGGTFIFVAVSMLINQLSNAGIVPPDLRSGDGRPFYIAGLAYLLLGIIIGSGLWFGWGEVLQIAIPIEVHIHANSWGFMALMFAGLFIDLYPAATGKKWPWPNSIRPIFWLLVVGALGLVLGPWIPSNWFTVPGLIMHMVGTIWLLANAIRAQSCEPWPIGVWHMITSYFWFFAPVLVAPLIILKVPGFPGAGIENNAPQALIYGWVLQFGYAVLPYVFSRLFHPDQEAELGGSVVSLIAVHLGGGIFWAGIFLTEIQGVLHGTAYTLWVLSILPILSQLWSILQKAPNQESDLPATILDEASGSS